MRLRRSYINRKNLVLLPHVLPFLLDILVILHESIISKNTFIKTNKAVRVKR